MSDPSIIYEETLKNLKSTYTCKNNEERLQAEKKLALLEKEIFRNFNMFLRNLSIDKNVDGNLVFSLKIIFFNFYYKYKNLNKIEDDAKLSTLVYFKKILKSKIIENSLSCEESNFVIFSLIDIIFESKFNDICLNNITALLQVFLNNDQISRNGIFILIITFFY